MSELEIRDAEGRVIGTIAPTDSYTEPFMPPTPRSLAWDTVMKPVLFLSGAAIGGLVLYYAIPFLVALVAMFSGRMPNDVNWSAVERARLLIGWCAAIAIFGYAVWYEYRGFSVRAIGKDIRLVASDLLKGAGSIALLVVVAIGLWKLFASLFFK